MRIVILILAISTIKVGASEVTKLRFTPECIFNVLLSHKRVAYKPEIPLPTVHFASTTPLQQFQDDVEEQWGERPARVQNVYVPTLNRIYLIDDADYYKKTNRFIDDSLVHEFVHYIQLKYLDYPEKGADDHMELEAVYDQTWFRENIETITCSEEFSVTE